LILIIEVYNATFAPSQRGAQITSWDYTQWTWAGNAAKGKMTKNGVHVVVLS